MKHRGVRAKSSRLREVKPPSMMDMHVDSLARDSLGEHPMLKKLKPRIRQAVMGAMKGMKGMSRKKATVARM